MAQPFALALELPKEVFQEEKKTLFRKFLFWLISLTKTKVDAIEAAQNELVYASKAGDSVLSDESYYALQIARKVITMKATAEVMRKTAFLLERDADALEASHKNKN